MNTAILRTVSLGAIAALAATTLAAAAPARARDTYTPSLSARAAVAVDTAQTGPVFRPAKALMRATRIEKRSAPSAGYSAKRTPKRATSRSTASPARVDRSRTTASELQQARAILAGLIRKYPILAGTTVEFGDARGYQAVCYYRSGRIVISPNHTASLTRILNHEVWHIIDWRDNGRIDWGENVPPK